MLQLVPMGTRLAEMARMRLEYDEARKRVQSIQQQLADLEESMAPGQAESDKDRLLLFQEKEQLLRELRSITPRNRSSCEMSEIQGEIRRLEQDLNNALEMSNRAIADRYISYEATTFDSNPFLDERGIRPKFYASKQFFVYSNLLL